MTNDWYDVAVVGAGPAGCSAAITLAERGARVALIEAGELNHDKLCGEFLSPECGDLFSGLGVRDAIEALRPAQIRAVRFTVPKGTVWDTNLPSPGWGLSRRALDWTLANRASAVGARVLEKLRVVAIQGDLEGGFQVKTDREIVISARAVISAHGKRTALDRELRRPFLRRQNPFIALKAHFSGPPLDHRVELHAFPDGYCGLGEIEGNQTNVCLLVRESVFRSAAQKGGDRIEALLHWMRTQNPHLDSWLSQAKRIDPRWLSIGQVPFCPKHAVERGILMAGDAAGLVVPLAGDGIAIALRSGSIAALQCARFLGGFLTATELTEKYGALWRRNFGRQLRWGRWLQFILLRPGLAVWGLRVLNAAPSLGQFLIARTRTLGQVEPEEKVIPRVKRDQLSP